MLRKRFNLLFSNKFSETNSTDIPSVVRRLSLKEKIFFWIFFWIFFVLLITLILQAHNSFLVEIPAYGGSFAEGVVGRPGFINPILAISDTDRDMSRLIYSGLLRPLPDGSLSLDLASGYTVSEDNLTYTITMRDNIYFHDGEPLTVDDVIFTVNKIKDPLLKSPLQASWDGVVARKIDEKTLDFTLEQPYALFPENLSVGIIPMHIWKKFATEDFINNTYNTNPIGSGPYKIDKVKRDSVGITEYYDLKAFNDFVLGKPFIEDIKIKFYPDEESLIEAYQKSEINTLGGVSPLWASTKEKLDTTNFPLARVFAVFLNQSESQIFTHREVRIALNRAVDREQIVEDILGGYGNILFTPLPGSILPDKNERVLGKIAAKNILIENEWKLNENGVFKKETKNSSLTLAFDLATANVPELKSVAQEIKRDWEEIGARVELKIFEVGDLNQEVIRPRDYHALLFGEVTGRNPDLYAFWHSSQRLDPGLNIAQYANITADKLLEDARLIENRDDRLLTYKEFQDEVNTDIPAIFIYTPDYIYIPSSKIKNIQVFPLTNISDRFINIHKWHIHTDKVWKFFINN